jgi:hypothetical protein
MATEPERETKPDDLLEIPGWEGYLNYVRGDRHTRRSTLSQVNLNVAETLDMYDKLTIAEAGAFIRLLVEYARRPLRDDVKDVRGPRQLTRKAALRCLDGAGTHRSRFLTSLEQKGFVTFVPDASRLEFEYEVENEFEVEVANGNGHRELTQEEIRNLSDAQFESYQRNMRAPAEPSTANGHRHLTTNGKISVTDPTYAALIAVRPDPPSSDDDIPF